MKKFASVFAYFLLFSPFCVVAQDIHFSQYNLTPLVVNPAQAGAYKAQEVILNYKSQWGSIHDHGQPGQGYKTMMLSYDGRLMQGKWKNKWLATGVNLFNDVAGAGRMGTMQANVYFGYHIQLDQKNTLGGCLMGGFAQRSIADYANFTWDEQYINGTHDPIAPSNEPVVDNSFGYPDVGLGILYQYTKGQMYSTANDMIIIHAGAAVTHLNQPNYFFYTPLTGEKERLAIKTTGHVEGLIGIKNTNFSVLPGFIYMGQGSASEILPGCYFRYMLREQSRFTGFVKGASIMVGTYLRVRDAFIPSVQFEIAEYTIGFSYDMNVSALSNATNGLGGFEISLRWGTPNPFQYKSAASFQ